MADVGGMEMLTHNTFSLTQMTEERDLTRSYDVDFCNPLQRLNVAKSKPTPHFINATSIKEVMHEDRRPLTGPRSGFNAKLQHHGKTEGQRFWETTSFQAFSDPNSRVKADCEHDHQLELVLEKVNDALVVTSDFEIGPHSIKEGDQLLQEGKMHNRQRHEILKLTKPVCFCFRRKEVEADTGAKSHAAGLSVLEAASKDGGMQVGVLTGEHYRDAEDDPKATHCQRAWMIQGDPALEFISYGGRKPNVDNNSEDCDHFKIAARREAAGGFVYKNRSDVTKLSNLGTHIPSRFKSQPIP